MKQLRLLFTLVAVCMASLAWSAGFTVEGIRYSITDEVAQTVTVVGWDNSYFADITDPLDPNYQVGDIDEDQMGPVNLNLPWRVLNNGLYYRVTAIGDEAFSECVSMKSVIIPNTVLSIGDLAFQGCVNLDWVKVLWTTPLAIDASVFEGIDLAGTEDDPESGVALYCLSGYQSVYGAADVWKNFKMIGTYDVDADLDVIIMFEDPYVKEICVSNWDTNGDGELSYREAFAVTDIGAAFVGDTNITSFNEFRSFGNVTSIGQSCFRGCSNLESIIIPPRVKTIGQTAFMGCDNLTSVTLATNSSSKVTALTTIGNRAFEGCAKMTGLNLSSAGYLKSIGDHAFDGCASIKNFFITASVNSIGVGAFANCDACVSYWVAGDNKVYKHAGNYLYIVDKATSSQIVAYATGAKSQQATIGEGIVEILPYAFAGAKNLTYLDLTKVETIGQSAFAGCSNLYTVLMPASLSVIGSDAFSGVAKGIRVQVEWPTPLAISNGTFSNAEPLQEDEITGRLFVPTGTKEIYAAAQGWNWFQFIENGTIADYAASIITFADEKTKAVCLAAFDTDGDGYLTFDEAAAVTSLGTTFQNSQIGSFDEFKYFTGLTVVEDNAFSGSTITSIVLPETITTIGRNAFAGCAGFTTFTIPANVVTIASGAFTGCSGMTAYKVDEANEFFAGGVSGVLFSKDHTTLIQYPVNLKAPSVIFPDEVESVAAEAFRGATHLQEIIFSATIGSIGEKAFADCTSLKHVKTLWAAPLEVPADIFEGVDLASDSLSVPNGSEEAYRNAPVWKDFGRIGTFKMFILFEDPNVEAICLAHFDTNGDGRISYDEAEAVTDLGDLFKGNADITTFRELADFTSLTEIKPETFKDCISLKTVAFSNKIETIGDRAFEGCSVLTMPTLSRYVHVIGERAFYGCGGITTVTIPKYVETIGDGAFANCQALTRFVATSNANYISNLDILFTKDISEVVAYPAGKTKADFTVSQDYVKTIRPYAFSGASHLKTIKLHMIETIGHHAFEQCTGLNQIELNEGLKTIGEGAFSDCQNLQQIKIPANVTTIEAGAFTGMPTAVRCQVEWTTPLEIADGTFSNYETLGEGQIPGILFVPEGTKELYENAPGWKFFSLVYETDMSEYAANLITFADPVVRQLAVAAWDTDGDNQLSYDEAAAVTSLGTVFTGQSISTFNELKYFTSLTELGDNCFKDTKLTAFTVPETVTRIGNSALQGTAISRWNTLPGLTEIGDSAFAYNTGFTALTLSANIVKLGTGAFKGCPNLTAINVQSGNPYYSSAAGVLYDKSGAVLMQFPSAKAVKGDYVIAPTIKEIGEDAFLMSQNLKSVSIPASVEKIGPNAFRACELLDSVTVSWPTPLAVPANTFEGVNVANAVLCVPKGLEELYQAADVWKDFGRMSVYLGDNNIIEFEDPIVKQICVSNWDLDGDGEMTVAEAKAVNSLSTVFALNATPELKKFNELKYFTGLTVIPTNSFRNCTGLESITLPNTITEIAYGAFSGCSSLKSITIPAAVEKMGNGPFTSCTSLEKFVVDPENKHFVAIDGVLFNYNKTNLVAFPGAKAGDYTIPESVNTLTQYAFSGAENLTQVRLPAGITAIPNGTFNKCTALQAVNIPASVRSIGVFAFTDCDALSKVKVAWDTPLSVLADVFRNTYIEDARLYVPAGKKAAYAKAAIWSTFREIVEYPNCDVNGDGLADMLDAVDVVKFVLGSPADVFDEYLADFDADEAVTVADAVNLLNQIAAGTAAPNILSAPKRHADADEQMSLTIDPNHVISLCLDNTQAYTALQFDLTLPEGAEVNVAELTARKDGHQVLFNKVGERTYRFVAISLAGRSFKENEGALINVFAGFAEADEIIASNIRMVTEQGTTRYFDDIMAAMPTDIQQVMTQAEGNADGAIYNLNGMRVERPGKGVYIVNGKKVIIK